ncbi:MAG: TonB-dependent receptor [Bacteroidales bacterium]
MQVSFKRIHKGTFTFRRWSRQPYAVFRSLGAEVRIAGLALAVSAVFVPWESLAQKQDTLASDSRIDMDEVVVTARSSEVIYSQMARVVEVLDENEIRKLPVQSVDQLLEYAMNVDVRKRGGMNVQADISIRAGSFDQVMILLNGVNITDPQTGHHNLNLPVDLSAIKRIEILSGPGSRIFGPNAFSGAIHIITGTEQQQTLNTGFHAGENGYAKATANTALQAKNTDHFIAAAYARSDGYIKNTDFDIGSFFYRNTWQPHNDHRIDFQAGYNHKKFGANSFYTPVYPGQLEQVRTKFSSICYRADLKLKTEAKLYWRRNHDRFELFRNTAPDWYAHHNYHMSDVGGASVNSTIPLKIGELSIGAEYRMEKIQSNVLGKVTGDTIVAPGEKDGFFTKASGRDNVSVFGEYVMNRKNLYAAAGLMANYNTAISNQWKFFPGLDINYRFNNYFHAFASGNYGMRLPAFTDLYYESPTNQGNQNLKPEESATVEAGAKLFFANNMVRAAGFYRRGNNIIDWLKKEEQDKWKTMNLTTLNTTGLSIQFKSDLKKIFPNSLFKMAGLSYSFAYQEKNAENYISQYAMDYLRNKMNLRVQNRITEKFNLLWALTWQDRAGSFILYENGAYGKETAYKPFWMLDLRLSYTWESISLYSEVANLFDVQYYDIGNVPQPGRWLKFGLQWELKLKS